MQGWWPLCGIGYHKGDYSYPKTEDEIFEVCLGVILTQNTSFGSVEKSLENLRKLNCLNHEKIKNMPLEQLKDAIKPSGYFNQKSDYILNFIEFFQRCDIPTREELLNIKGIGPESADSILLYGYAQKEFVVDTYTKRIFANLGLISENAKYNEIKKVLVDGLKDKRELLKIYQEFHALIVAHAKRFYSKKPYGKGCPLASMLKKHAKQIGQKTINA